MRKIVVFVVAAAMTTATFFIGAPPAQASPACFGTPGGPVCDWVYNPSFNRGEQYWTFQGGAVVMPIGDACLYNGPYVAELRWSTSTPQPSISQQMSIWAGHGPRFSVGFDLYLRNDQENFYDAFNVIVTDLNTGSVEKFQYVGSNFNSTCRIEIPLSKNYSGHTVELKFTLGPFTRTGYYQVDNVHFWSLP